MTVRSTIPRASSSFIRSESRRSDSSGTACAISEKRSGPSISTLQDRARPAPADQLDRLVVEGAAVAAARVLGRAARPDPRSRHGGSRPSATLSLTAYAASSCRDASRGAVDRHLAGDVDHRREALERHRRDRLEDLLVVPAASRASSWRCIGGPAVLQQRLEVAQQRRLALGPWSRTGAPARPRRAPARPRAPPASASRCPARSGSARRPPARSAPASAASACRAAARSGTARRRAAPPASRPARRGSSAAARPRTARRAAPAPSPPGPSGRRGSGICSLSSSSLTTEVVKGGEARVRANAALYFQHLLTEHKCTCGCPAWQGKEGQEGGLSFFYARL